MNIMFVKAELSVSGSTDIDQCDVQNALGWRSTSALGLSLLFSMRFSA
jgi:hypothetical protein